MQINPIGFAGLVHGLGECQKIFLHCHLRAFDGEVAEILGRAETARHQQHRNPRRAVARSLILPRVRPSTSTLRVSPAATSPVRR